MSYCCSSIKQDYSRYQLPNCRERIIRQWWSILCNPQLMLSLAISGLHKILLTFKKSWKTSLPVVTFRQEKNCIKTKQVIQLLEDFCLLVGFLGFGIWLSLKGFVIIYIFAVFIIICVSIWLRTGTFQVESKYWLHSHSKIFYIAKSLWKHFGWPCLALLQHDYLLFSHKEREKLNTSVKISRLVCSKYYLLKQTQNNELTLILK